MRKSQLDFLCETFGDSNLPSSEKWKCIKYIFIENPIVDVQKLIKNNEIQYIGNSDNGPGFYILGTPNADFGIVNLCDKVVTFIPLKLIDKISLICSSDLIDNNLTIEILDERSTV